MQENSDFFKVKYVLTKPCVPAKVNILHVAVISRPLHAHHTHRPNISTSLPIALLVSCARPLRGSDARLWHNVVTPKNY